MNRTLTIALTLLIVLGGFAYWDTKHSAQLEEKKGIDEAVLYFKSDDVQKIELTNKSGIILLEKDSATKNWLLKKPIEDNAENDTVKGFLESLAGEKFEQVASEGESDPGIFGFGQNNSKLKIDLVNNKSLGVLVGGDAPVPGKLYVVREGEKKILLANTSIRSQIDKTAKDFRNRKIATLNRDAVREINIQFAKQKVLVQKNKDGKWELPGVGGELADGESVESYLDAVESLRANDFYSERTDKELGLNKPEVTVRIGYLEKASQSLVLMASPKKENSTAVRVSGKREAYQLYSTVLDQLMKTTTDFRDKTAAFYFPKDKVKSLQVTSKGRLLELKKEGTVWKSAKEIPKGKEISQIQAITLVDRLRELRASDFLPSQKEISASSAFRVFKLSDEAGQLVFELRVGEKIKGKTQVEVWTNYAKQRLSVDQALLDVLPVNSVIIDIAPKEAKPSAAATDEDAATKAAIDEITKKIESSGHSLDGPAEGDGHGH